MPCSCFREIALLLAQPNNLGALSGNWSHVHFPQYSQSLEDINQERSGWLSPHKADLRRLASKPRVSVLTNRYGAVVGPALALPPMPLFWFWGVFLGGCCFVLFGEVLTIFFFVFFSPFICLSFLISLPLLRQFCVSHGQRTEALESDKLHGRPSSRTKQSDLEQVRSNLLTCRDESVASNLLCFPKQVHKCTVPPTTLSGFQYIHPRKETCHRLFILIILGS